ncbi:MAG: heavy-metal-associated domain-containing protein [Betaproteobacteria bacterium]|nr:heavy-metal-associated domain-containing protein [Betaproteobacteria bacterium]MCC6248674.1 heavy-metal-associated domain-containing protein [Rubrivivax sp.]MCL4700143.1 heavy-metal-associated domain-containing protein [Burkholderiaceae bacterium]
MIAFQVEDMTCGHCASTITRALKAADPNARVTVDLTRRRVTVEATHADAAELHEAIADAGYTPAPVEVAIAPPATTEADACCGHCR